MCHFNGYSRYFSRQEFACRCGCGADTVDYELIVVMTRLRKHFNRAVRINSGVRCLDHNRAIGSKDSSQHVRGKACDFAVVHADCADVADYLDRRYPHRYGIGRYATFTHLDVRKNLARWNKTITLT